MNEICYKSKPGIDGKIYSVTQLCGICRRWLVETFTGQGGEITGRKSIALQPANLEILDEADLDTTVNDCGWRKIDVLVSPGNEIRCIERGDVL